MCRTWSYTEIDGFLMRRLNLYHLQGNVLGSLNKLDKAESIFLRVLRQDDQNIDALLGLSLLQSRRENYHQVSSINLQNSEV